MQAIVALVRRLGALDAALFVVARVLERATGRRARLIRYWFMAQPVPGEGGSLVARAEPRITRPTARPGAITVEEMHAGDPRFDRFERPAAELARRFATGSRCFAAWQGDALAGFLWFTDREYAEDEVQWTFRVDPSDRAVWDLDVHIVPRFRLGRTFALLWEHAFAAMRGQGMRWTISRVDAFNSDSIRAHQRLGALRTGWAVFVSFGSYQCTLSSPGGLRSRRLEHGPYPVMVVRAPGGDQARTEKAAASGAATA